METSTGAEYEMRDGLMLVRATKALYVFTEQEKLKALKRGKYWRRNDKTKKAPPEGTVTPRLYR